MARILLADDQPDILESVALLLEIEGHEVVLAADGSEAMEAARTEPQLDVAILDVNMPFRNGLEVAIALRKLRPRVKVIIHTGLPETSVRPIFSHYDAFFRKPADPRRLLDAIEAPSAD